MLNLTLCDKLDKYGYYYLSDLISRKIVAQYIQPSNNQNVPISDRVVPWSALDGDLAQRDYDRVHNDPRFREKEYIVLDGVFEPGAYPSDGGTSNLSPTKTKNIHKDTINKLNKMLAFDLDSHERAAVFKQIDKMENTGDDITHKIYLLLNKITFAPLNRNDIQALTSRLDDVADAIQEASGRMYLYHIDDFLPPVKEI